MPMFQITIIPVTGKANIGVSDYISEIIQFLKDSKADYTLTPTATVVNCDTIEECFSTMYKMHTLLFDKHDLPRIITSIMIDDRRDMKVTPQDKIRDVESKLT